MSDAVNSFKGQWQKGKLASESWKKASLRDDGKRANSGNRSAASVISPNKQHAEMHAVCEAGRHV